MTALDPGAPAVPSTVPRELGIERYEPTSKGAPDGARRSPGELTELIRNEALLLGFSRIGVARTGPLERGRDKLEAFREQGYAGTMSYLEQGARHDPRDLLPEAESAVVVALRYGDPDLVPLRTRKGLAGGIARYARGEDYHLVVKRKLQRLAARVADIAGRPVLARACVDTAPILERELAERAGVGFIGKSTLLIAPGIGSFVVLGELLLDLELEPTTDVAAGCGSCRACLDACPTGAFAGEHVLDARRCVSYLTIEYEGLIPDDLRRGVGMRVFGCDVCQDVCPFNASSRARPASPELRPRPGSSGVDLVELLNLGSAAYRKLVRRTALRRTSRTTLQRNAAIALGNSRDPSAVAPLARALREHPRPIVRAHAAWALAELGGLDAAARAALEDAAAGDPDPVTREEARKALVRLEGPHSD